MVFVDEFIQRIESPKVTNNYTIDIEYKNDMSNLDFIKEHNAPLSIICFFNKIQHIKIIQPREFQILRPVEMELIDDKYIHFSNVNKHQKICFDISKTNAAGEWDIIAYPNIFLITKTMGSYITNKTWAWVDRGREIWTDEKTVV